MSSFGIPGRKGFDIGKEFAKEYPHKWSSSTLYRDYLRVIQRKYDGSKKKFYENRLRDSFREHKYISDEQKMNLMGTGPTTLGGLAVEEELYNRGIKHPEHPSRYDMIDIISSNMDTKRIHPLPYLVQRDMWYYFGVGENQQDTLATKTNNKCKDINNKYTEMCVELRDKSRQWLCDRLELFEESYVNQNINNINNENDGKINELFNYIKGDNEYINYKNMYNFLFDENKTEYNDLLKNGDNIKLYPESWLYICDQLCSMESLGYKFTSIEEFTKYEDVGKYRQESFYNPKYKQTGLTFQDLKDCYLKYKFFNLENHYNKLKNIKNTADNQRIYNLFAEVSMNIPSIYLIIQHGISTGEYLYSHILNPDEDPDKVTWEKLEEIHKKQGTKNYKNILNKAKESQEIHPQDILYYNPDENESEILKYLPQHHTFWGAIFEDTIVELPDFIIDDYYQTIVKPDYGDYKDGDIQHRNELIEKHVYEELTKYIQPWLWKRYASMKSDPAFGIETWNNKKIDDLLKNDEQSEDNLEMKCY